MICIGNVGRAWHRAGSFSSFGPSWAWCALPIFTQCSLRRGE
jgi:hypothetical protein